MAQAFLPRRVDLAPADIELMGRVRDGADVFDLTLAHRLRELAHVHPTLLEVTAPMGLWRPPHAAQPILGAVLTEAGRAALQEAHWEATTWTTNSSPA